MLSRVAESLYWMSRYVERAENIARIVDVNQQLMLDIPSRQAEKISRNWFPIVMALGDDDIYQKSHRKSDASSVVEFLVFEREHLGSIVGCLSAARENARTVREQISSEMWEQLNLTYWWCHGKSARQTYERSPYDFFQRIKTSLQLFQGITDNSMLHGDGWDFIQIGKFLERADKTSRLLDEEFHLLKADMASPNDQLLQWMAVLRSCSARLAYQRVYLSDVKPVKVAELLLLEDSFPRSVDFCLKQADQALRRLSGVASGRYSNLAEKLSGRLLAELSFSSIEDMYALGLHRAMDELQTRLNHLGDAIRLVYIEQSLPQEPARFDAPQLPQMAQQ